MKIEDYLRDWKTQNSQEQRSFKLLPNSVVNGENLFMLTMKLNVKYEDKLHKVSESILFQTFNSNASKKPKSIRNDADKLLLDRMCQVLSQKFHASLEQTISKIYQNI